MNQGQIADARKLLDEAEASHHAASETYADATIFHMLDILNFIISAHAPAASTPTANIYTPGYAVAVDAEVARLTEDRDALRAALESIRDMAAGWDTYSVVSMFNESRAVARLALVTSEAGKP